MRILQLLLCSVLALLLGLQQSIAALPSNQQLHSLGGNEMRLVRQAVFERTAQQINVEIKNAGTVQESIAILSQQPELAYLATLQSNPNINWNQVNEAYHSWNQKQSGLTPDKGFSVWCGLALRDADNNL